jgi:O-antigen ligase
LTKSYKTIVERFLHAPVSSGKARDYFEGAAAAMLRQNPWGIGINQYSHVLSTGNYANAVAEYDRSGLVHNLYWLTLAELGYAGFAAFMLLMAAPLVLALRGAWRARGDIRGDILAGCAAGMVALYAQSLLEWVARQTVMGYLYWGVAALVYALWRDVAHGSGVAVETSRGATVPAGADRQIA